MAMVLERRLTPVTGRPGLPESSGEHSKLEIAVVFTSVQATLAALEHAGALAHRLDGRITIFVPQVVAYPAPLTSPPVLIEWNERRFRVLAETCPVETTVRLYLCRQREETLKYALDRRSIIVLAGPRRWWRFTAEKRLARALRRSGYEVVFLETE